jgi:pyruvate/2-oxoglutarate dehydrogenase complex dihydrolipoamide acyltransferase (E2) component
MQAAALRRYFATAHLRAPGGPASFVVEAVTKSPGQPVSFGETFALLRNNNQQVIVTAPVSGQVLSLGFKVGDVVSPDAELAAFEGRKPLIEFRHLKGPLTRQQSTSAAHSKAPTAATSNSIPAPTSAPPAPAPKPAAQPGFKTTTTTKSFLDLPPNYGRLPPLTAKEAALLHSGGAYDS